MAESALPIITLRDPRGGFCRLVLIIEDTQTQPDSEGFPQPIVVRTRIENTSQGRAFGRWVQSNGTVEAYTILPGENQETNISPPRRMYLHRFEYSLGWALNLTAQSGGGKP